MKQVMINFCKLVTGYNRPRRAFSHSNIKKARPKIHHLKASFRIKGNLSNKLFSATPVGRNFSCYRQLLEGFDGGRDPHRQDWGRQRKDHLRRVHGSQVRRQDPHTNNIPRLQVGSPHRMKNINM